MPKAKVAQVRIIAGALRGRKIPVLDMPGLRPTSDRMRETLFNWLMPHIQGSRCLDLFAGSGALGFEACSRGAAEVVLVDLEPKIIEQLQGSQDQLGLTNVSIIQADASQALAAITQPFDVVFLDPPFHQQLLPKAIDWLSKDCLDSGSLIYVEAEQALENLTIPSDWRLLRQAHAGKVNYYLYVVGSLDIGSPSCFNEPNLL